MAEEKSNLDPTLEEITPQQASQLLAERFAAARIASGYSIEELAYATKIMAQFILFIEKGELQKLPGEVFVRGFLKSIFKVINQDPKPYLTLCTIAFGRHAEKPLVVSGSPGASRVRIGSEQQQSWWNEIEWRKIGGFLSIFSQRRLLLAGFSVAAVVTLIIVFSNSPKSPSTKTVQTVAKENPAPAKDEATVPSEEVASTPNTQEAATTAESKTTPTEADKATTTIVNSSGSGEQLLELFVKEPVNIRINVDNRGWETARYEPDTYRIKFTDDVNLLVLDAAAVDISYNGKPLGALGGKGRVRRLSFVAKNTATPPRQNL